MALPTLNDGYEVTDVEWNAHVTEINRLLDKPHARYYKSVGQTLPDGNEVCSFDTAQSTHAGVTASGTDNTQFTLNRAGVWYICASIRMSSNGSAGERYATVRDAADNSLRFAQDNNYPDGAACLAPGMTRRFNSGDSVEVGLFNSSGASVTVEGSFGEGTSIALTWIAP